MNIVIHGYTAALQEGDNLTLTCETDSEIHLGWILTPDGKIPKLISQNRTFHRYGIELSDAGEYTCTPYDRITRLQAYAYFDLTASVRVEVLKSVTDNSNSVEVFTHNIITGFSTTDTSLTDNSNSVEVFTHSIIIGGCAAGVIVIIIIVALVIALVQSCRKQARFARCKYKLILLMFHLKSLDLNCKAQC